MEKISLMVDTRIIDNIVKAYTIHKSVILSSGISNDCYYDIKSLMLNNLAWNQIKNLVWQDIRKKFPEVVYVAGMGVGGTILAMRLAEFRLAPLIIRDAEKSHGLLKQVEGNFSNGTPRTVIVDDVCTTGKSFIKAKKILRKNGLKSLGNYTFLKRKESNFRCESFVSMW